MIRKSARGSSRAKVNNNNQGELYHHQDQNYKNHCRKRTAENQIRFDRENCESSYQKNTRKFISLSKPLQQIKNSSFPISSNPLGYKKDHPFEKCLKSQTSLNDLSQIVTIDLLSSDKKDLKGLMQPESQIDTITYHQPNKNKLFTKKPSKESVSLKQMPQDEQSLHLDDFQILEIYSTTAIKTQQKVFLMSNTSQKNRTQMRLIGGIRRNSKMSIVSDRVSQLDVNESITITNDSFEEKGLSQSIWSIESQNSNTCSRSPFVKEQFDTLKFENYHIDEADICSKKLFRLIGLNKNFMTQQDLEKSPLNCQIRLILGPIMTKFRQKKYSQLNLSDFCKEIASIFKDFSGKERLELCEKILSDRHVDQKFQTNVYDNWYKEAEEQQNLLMMKRKKISSTQHQKLYQLEAQRRAFQQIYRLQNELQPQSKTQQSSPLKPTNQCEQSKYQNHLDLSTQNRLSILTSKIDFFLNKINGTQEHKRNLEIQKRLKGSISVMSQLSDIEELSGDSEDLELKKDFGQNAQTNLASQTQQQSMRESMQPIIARDFYTGKYVNYAENGPEQYNSRAFESYQPKNHTKNPNLYDQLRSNQIQQETHDKLYPSNSHHKFHYEGTIRPSLIKAEIQSSLNSFSRNYANSDEQRFIQKMFTKDNDVQITSRVSFKTINLKFNQLSKYLNC